MSNFSLDDEKPLDPVAILLATYNGSEFIKQFLDSLCNQTYRNFRVYVRDDGSSDGTLSIIKEYASKLNICVLDSHERLGSAKSFFKLMKEVGAGHMYYMLADQDDYWLAYKVERAVSALKGSEEQLLLYCSRLEYVDERLNHLGLSHVPRLLAFENALVENVAAGCTICITRRLRYAVLSKLPSEFIMHDWWLYLYATAFGNVIYDIKPTIKYRQHSKNSIGVATNFVEILRRRWIRFQKHDSGIYRISQQAKYFLDCYGSSLNPNYRNMLERLSKIQHGLIGRIYLAIKLPGIRQKFIDALFLRLIILIGRY